MALQTSGLIDASDINNELGVATGSQLSLNSSTARTLAGITSGPIKYSDFYGKSNALTKIVAITLPGATITGNNFTGGTYIDYRGFADHDLIANHGSEYPRGVHGSIYDRSNNSWLSASSASTTSSPIMSFTKRVYSSSTSYTDDKADIIIAGLYCYRRNSINQYSFVLRLTYSDTAKLLAGLPYTTPPAYNGYGPFILQTGFTSLKLYTGANATIATATPFYTFSRSQTFRTSQDGSQNTTFGAFQSGVIPGISLSKPVSNFTNSRISVDSSGTATTLTNPSNLYYGRYHREWVWNMGTDATVWNAFAPPSTTGGYNISFKFE